eukprot:5427048-Ditylum_brightwellii.AAC.1
MVGTYISFLFATLGVGKSDKLTKELKAIKDELKTVSAYVKVAKASVFSATTKADKTLKQAGDGLWVNYTWWIDGSLACLDHLLTLGYSRG